MFLLLYLNRMKSFEVSFYVNSVDIDLGGDAHVQASMIWIVRVALDLKNASGMYKLRHHYMTVTYW